MSDDVRLERLLADVLVGAASARPPDRLVPDILRATSRARRRPRWLAFGLERPMRLNRKVVVGSHGARVATLAFVAFLAAALGVGTVIGAASLVPSPTPVPGPTTRPSPATALSPLPTFKPVADRSGCCLGNPNYLPGFGFRLPAGWTQVADTMHSEVFVKSTGLARGTVALHWAAAVATNDRACAGVIAPGVGTTAAEIVAALEKDPRLVVSAAQPASLAGYTGQTLELELDSNWMGTCSWSGGKPAALLVTAGGEQVGPFFGITGSERVRVFILDVHPGSDRDADPSVVAWFSISADERSFDTVLSEGMPLVESFTFHP